ncbi:uncharacterized protein LOC111633473 isoform X2 [Centruroides sculpturatus]|nr:uncharacterized protein LOC111633473 isoform X2 [Centruroides sculpturatus]
MASTSIRREKYTAKKYSMSISNKLRRIQNARSLMEQKYCFIKKRIDELLNVIRMEILNELEEIVKLKFNSLEKIEKRIKETSKLLSDNFRNIPQSEHINTIPRIEDIEEQILSHLFLVFVPDVSNAKYSIGYIKCSPIKPEDLCLEINKKIKFKYGTELEVKVKSCKPWYFMTLRSLSGLADNGNGEKILPEIMDKEDGSFKFLFRLNDGFKYRIEITLYDRPIKNSPVVVEIEPNQQNDRCKKSMPKTSSTKIKKNSSVESKTWSDFQNYSSERKFLMDNLSSEMFGKYPQIDTKMSTNNSSTIYYNSKIHSEADKFVERIKMAALPINESENIEINNASFWK